MTEPGTAAEPGTQSDPEPGTGNEIAIIGMAGRFPGAADPDALWRNLRGGVESITRFEPAELAESPLLPQRLRAHPDFVPAGAVLDAAGEFDYAFFGTSLREAQLMDPQQRVFLEVAWAALEDAGYDPARVTDRVAVYAGAGASTHLVTVLGQLAGDPASLYEALGAATSENLATKVSFQLGLRGESVTVHTACSTGLAAVHLACQSLLTGQSRLALAGAVRLSLPQRTGYLYQEGMILSADGHCRAFDHRASGTVAGNGAGAVVLKALPDALADGDHIHAVIRGSALNNDGHRGVGYTAPSVAGQAEVVAEALAFAGLSGADIGYLEAHGTGTPLGDPIEIAALTRAYRATTDRVGDLPIGSVKTNLGHLDAAAGIAGLVKVVLMLRHGEIPPSLHFEQPNPAIEFAGSPFMVNAALRPWPRGEQPRRAGVSSFGIGGTNVHAVLEEPPPSGPPAGSTRPYQLVTLSARSRPALARLAAGLAEHVTGLADSAAGDPGLASDPEQAGDPGLADLAYTRAVGRAEFSYRRSYVAATTGELATALGGAAPDDPAVTAPPRVGFLFPGQGAAHYGMAGPLYQAEPQFRAELDEVLAVLRPLLDEPLQPILFAGSGPIDDPALAHPALFAMEYALARLWLRWGVQPAALLGHSFGEYPAACLAGVLALPDAAALAVTRGRLVAQLPEGRMLAVGLAEQQLAQWLADSPALALAAVNGGQRCVVSGPVEAVDQLRERLAAAAHPVVPLPVRHAFHSPAVEPVLAELAAAAAGYRHQPPQLPLLSSLTGQQFSADGAGGDYWARQMREPVRFGPALEQLAAGPPEQPLLLLEVGPDQALTALARDQLGKRATVVASLPAQRGTAPAHRVLLQAVGKLWAAGAPIDWPAFYRHERRRRVPLPTYPFERSPVDNALSREVGVPRVLEAPLPAKLRSLPAEPAGEPARADGPRDEVERQVFTLWQERLGSTEFGIHDNFLELGGNSLIAAQLLTRLREVFSVPIPLGALFEAPTVAGIAERIRALTGEPGTGPAGAGGPAPGGPPAVPALPPIRPGRRPGPVPLSVVQERTLAMAAADPDNPALAMPVAVAIDGEPDLALLAQALGAVVERHESLRTTFHHTGIGWQARIEPAGPVELPVEEVAGEQAAQAIARTEPARPFNLASSPLRARLLRLAADRHILLLTLHHVVSDTLSMVILVRELAASYRAFHAGEPSPLPPLPVQYADFAGWQRDQLAGAALERQRDYWRDRLADPPPPLALPADRPSRPGSGVRGEQLPVRLPAELSTLVAEFSQRLGVTAFVTLLAAYTALLGRVTGADDLVVGTPVGNRERPELEPLIGYVAHAVPLRADLREDPRFAALVEQLQATLLAAYAHPDLPYEQLAGVAADSRLFDAVFVLHAGLPQEQELPGMTWRLWEVTDAPAMFGATLATLTLMLAAGPDGYAGSVGYATERFEAATARRLFEQFQALLTDALRRPETRLSQLRLGPPAPATRTAADPPPAASPSGVDWSGLLAAARDRPDQPALRWPGGQLSWRELAGRTDPAAPHRGPRHRLVTLLRQLRAGEPVRLAGRQWSTGEVAGHLASLRRCLPASSGAVLATGPDEHTEEPLDLVWALATGRPVRIEPIRVPRWLPAEQRDPRPLRLSLSYFANDEDALAGPKYQLLLAGARLADELGFAAIWTPERHFHSFGGLYPNPTATSAGLATATRRLGIRAGSVVMPLHDPIRVAEDWAVIDNLSGGRVGVSFASGWHPDDFVLAPDRYADRREVMREGIETVRRLWRGEPVRRRNGVGEEVEIAIRPRPVQPVLPFWLTAAGSPDTFRLAGEMGGYLLTNLMAQTLPDLGEKIALYRDAWQAAGHDGDGHVTLMLHAFLAPDPGQAFATAREPLLRYFRSSVDIARGFAVAQGLAVRPEDLSEADIQALIEHGLERYLREGGLFGTPAGCAPLLSRVRELGVDEVAALVDYGTSTEDTLASVRLLGELVEQESQRASAAAQAAATATTDRVRRLAGLLTEDGFDTIQGAPDLLGWLAELAPAAVTGRTLLLPGPPARTAPPTAIQHGQIWLPVPGAPQRPRAAARARSDGGSALVVRPDPAMVAEVADGAGQRLGIGVVGELLLAGEPTGQRARWRAGGELDLLPGPVPHPRPAPLSFAQQRIWSLEQLVPGNLAYNNTMALRLRGELDRAALHQALREVVRRHEVLRSTFHATATATDRGDGGGHDGGGGHDPVQIVHPEVAVPLPVTEATPADVDRLAREHARQPYSLEAGPLLHARLLRLATDDHVLVIGMHHIVSDGWSAGVLFTELGSLYRAYAGNPTPAAAPLPPLTVQYPDYAREQRQRPIPATELEFWRQALAGVPVLELPTDRPYPPVQGQDGARYPVHIDQSLTADLARLCQREGVTPFMVLQAAFTALLHRYTGQTDLATGTAVAGRTEPAYEQLVGVFINTVVIRTDLAGDPSFTDLLGRTRQAVLAAIAHQAVPFERLVDELGVPRDLSHAPLVQAMLVLHNTPTPRLDLGELTIEGMEVDPGTAKLDLTLELREGPDGIRGAFEYRSDLFDEPTIAQLTRHLLALLRDALADPGRPVSRLSLLAADERARLLRYATGPALPAEPVATAHAAVQAQAARTPEAVAVGDPQQPLAYRELDARANQLAHGLRELGVAPGQRVALLLEPATEAVAGMLAVLKAGGAYVPLDPRAPLPRLAGLVEQAGPVVVLASDPATGPELGGCPVRGIEQLAAGRPATAPPPLAGPADPAYVVFTSGSTGRPKGVVVEHRQLLATTRARTRQYGPAAGRCLCLYPLHFDGSIGWVYYALFNGGTLWAPPAEVAAEPAAVADLIERHRIERIAGVPGYYAALLGAVPAGRLRSLVSSTVGGEACRVPLVRAHAQALPEIPLYNEYGPTEITVYCTAQRVDPARDGRVPIGPPIAGATAYVMDGYGQLCPPGAAGELYVGGAGVARGYLDDPQQTRERFVPDQFAGDPARLYRTGDRVRWNRHGELEFLGRVDRQLKVRGFRVEPAEIEATLLAHPAVAEAAVVTAGERLVGYLVPAAGTAPRVDEVRDFARGRLPGYLVPAELMVIEALPRTTRGKLDPSRLPATGQGGQPDRVPPRDRRESTLVDLVAGVLRREPATVGVHHNFFDLGGDSILAIGLVTRAREHGLELTVRQLFQNPTVAQLAAVANTRLAVPAQQGPVTGPALLTPIQRWFFGQAHPQPDHWNMSVALELAGPVRPDALAAAFRAVLAHHDALRLRFTREPGEPADRPQAWQAHSAASEPDWRLRQYDLSSLPPDRRAATLAERAEQLQGSLRLAEGPLLRAALINLGGGEPARLLITGHHLVTDGVSWRIILADLFTAYQQLLAGQPVTLPAKTTSYQQWAQRLPEYPASPAGQAEIGYWQGLPFDAAPRLPHAAEPGGNTEARVVQRRVRLSATETAELLAALPRDHRSDPHTALLYAVARAVAGWTGSQRVQLDIERHGREELLPEVDLTRTVGWFSDFHPAVLPVPGGCGPAQQLAAVADYLRQVPNHGAGYVPLRYGAGKLTDLPTSELTVNYLGQLDSLAPAGAPVRVSDQILGTIRGAENRRPYLLEVTAGILDDQLFTIWSYPQGAIPQATIDRLAEDTLAAVRDLLP